MRATSLRESKSTFPQRAISNGGTDFHRGEHPFPNWEIAARALWPHKTAAHLAALTGVTDRAAKFWLAGQREPSPEAFKAVFDRVMTRNRSSGVS